MKSNRSIEETHIYPKSTREIYTCIADHCNTPHTGARRQSLRNTKYSPMEYRTQDQPVVLQSAARGELAPSNTTIPQWSWARTP